MWKYFISIIKVIPNFFKIIFFNLFHRNNMKHSRVRMQRFISDEMRDVSRKIGVKFVVSGQENLPNEQSYLVCPNHQAAYDAVTMISMFKNEPMSLVAKKELRKVPLVGGLNNSLGSVFMDRSNLKQELKDMLKVRKSLQNDDCKWVIFPEGTRTKDPNFKLGEFKPGAMKFPMSIGKKIIPCAIYGTKRVLDPKDHHKEYPVYVHFFPPISKEQYEKMSTNEVAHLLKEMIQKKVDEFIEFDSKQERR